MKKIIFAATLSLMMVSVVAQNNNHRPFHPNNGQHPTTTRNHHHEQTVQLNFNNSHGETFVIYIDGYPVNPKPRHQVSSINVEPGQHDICVRLVHPVDRVATLSMQFVHRQNNFTVTYNQRTETLGIIPEQGYGHTPPTPPTPPIPPTPPTPYTTPTYQPDPPIHANEAEISSIVDIMNNSPFDKDKLSLGKTFVKQHPVLTTQIIRMAKTITFDDSRLEFLTYAIDYCVDPQNYFQAVETLTYSSNRNKLLEVMNR